MILRRRPSYVSKLLERFRIEITKPLLDYLRDKTYGTRREFLVRDESWLDEESALGVLDYMIIEPRGLFKRPREIAGIITILPSDGELKVHANAPELVTEYDQRGK